MKKIIFIHVFFASAFVAFGQNTENQKSNWSVYWHPGSNYLNDYHEYTGAGDFEPYLTESKWNNPSYAYTKESYHRVLGSNYFSLINLGVQYDFNNGFSKSGKTSISIRSGINFLGSSIKSGGYYNLEQVLIDSTYNADYDITLQKDSLYTEGYYVFQEKKTVRWQNEILHKHLLFERLGIYYGVGLALSLEYDMRLLEQYAKNEYFVQTQSEGNRLYYYNYYPEPELSSSLGSVNTIPVDHEETTRKLKAKLGYSDYFPLGLDFRLSKKDEKFISRITFFGEGQIGFNFNQNAYNDWKSSMWLNHGLGMRFQI